MHYYSIADLCIFLGVERERIHYYIRKGFLIAKLEKNKYQISQADYGSFREEYYDTNKRSSSRGIARKIDSNQMEIFSNIVRDIENDLIDYFQFVELYADKVDLVQQVKEFILYKRDKSIQYDNIHKKYKHKYLSELYNLQIVTIKEICNLNKIRRDY